MKKVSRIISLIVLASIAGQASQLFAMATVRRGWEATKRRLSPSEGVQKVQNAMACMYSNNCTPQDIRNIKVALASLAALAAGAAAVRAGVNALGEKTVGTMMDKYWIHGDSKGHNLLKDLMGNDNALAGLFYSVEGLDAKDDFATLRALLELAQDMQKHGNTKMDHIIGGLKRKLGEG